MLYSAAQLTYLEHLGIDVWVPKAVESESVMAAQAAPESVALTAEAVSTEAVIPAAMDAPVIPAHFEDVPAPVAQTMAPGQIAPSPQATVQASVPVQQTPNPAVSALNSALSSAIPAPAFPKQRDTSADGQVATRLEFNIQFWCYSSGVWIISGDVNVTPEQHKLAHNLAHFIQGKKRRPRHVNVFSWPMIDSPNVDQGEAVALKYLQGHIERLQDVCPLKTVLLFNDCQYWPEQLGHVKLDMSLQNLLEDPSLKAKLWQTLRAHQHQD